MLPVLTLLGTLSALAEPYVPPPIRASADGLASCPTDQVEVFRSRLAGDLPRPTRQAVQTQYERAVADWAVCAHVQKVPGWTLPAVADPVASRVMAAVQAPRGSRARIEAAEAVAAEAPQDVAFIALDELEILALVARADPGAQLSLVAAALGAWGCPEDREWMDGPSGEALGWCPAVSDELTVALSALRRLHDLARPGLDPTHELTRRMADHTTQRWSVFGQIWVPIDRAPDLRGAEVAHAAAGAPVVPGAGLIVYVGRDDAWWAQRPAIRVGPGGVDVADSRPRATAPPPSEGAVVVAAAGVPAQRLFDQVAGWKARNARLAAMGPEGLVDLALVLRPDLVAREGLVLGPQAMAAEALQARVVGLGLADAVEPVVHVAPATSYATLVADAAVLAAVVGRPVALAP